MIQNLLHKFIRRTHFWRTVSISEMAELYSSRMLRVMAMGMFGGFGTVYLYQLGYSISFLAWFYVVFFLFRFISMPVVVRIIANYGPKHSILISNVMFIIGTVVLAATPYIGMWTFPLLLVTGGTGRALYDAAYLVDFSKVKHIGHSGKEIGIMQIIERVMTAASPIVGGIIALIAGPGATMLFAAFLMIISVVPLFFTSEPVKVHQKVTLRHFNFKSTWKSLVAYAAVGVDNNASGLVWNLFIVLVVFGSVSNKTYLEIGILSSVSLVASIVVAYVYGRIVDNRRGKSLLTFSAIGNAALYLLRPLINSPLQVAATNVANEFATSGYNIPSLRGVFATADGLPGYRIMYISLIVSMTAIGDAVASLVLALLTLNFSDADSVKWYFVILAPVVLLILLNRSVIYRTGILTRFIHRV